MDTTETKERWTAGLPDENRWAFFDTRVEAIDSGPDELGLEPGAAFTVGRCVDAAPPDLASLLVDALDSWAMDNAPEDHGEELVVAASTDPARSELEQLLEAWAKNHGVRPDWFDLAEESQHTAPEPDPLKIDPTNLPL